MSIMMLSACFFDRRSETLTALGFSALIILLFRPFALFDVGFILSYASVLGIVLIGSRMQYRFEKIRFKILNMVITTFCALLGTSIFTAHFFQRVTLFGALSNLLIIPLVTLLLPLGFLAGILGWMYMPLGRLLSYSLYVLLIGFEYIARLGSALPLAFANLPRPTAEVVIIYFGFAICCLVR